MKGREIINKKQREIIVKKERKKRTKMAGNYQQKWRGIINFGGKLLKEWCEKKKRYIPFFLLFVGT